MTETIVIAGAGHGAGQAVASLKQQKFAGNIVLIGEEPYLPYQRPPLSKKFLAGELPLPRLYVKPESFYDDANIEFRSSTRITRLDRDNRLLHCDSGEAASYDKLILATGSRVRKMELPGKDLDGIHYLRGIDDVEAIRAEMADGNEVVIVGAGYIGLEVAAVLRSLGFDVTVVEMADRVMSRVVSAEISDFYQIEHARHGVKLRLSTGVAGFCGEQRVTGVETAAGEVIAADFVIIGIGIEPNVELAAEAGIEVDNGIVVDDRCQTSDDRIFAIGDCSAHPSAIYQRRLRLESVQNALEQAKTAVGNLCGQQNRYDDVPWFWSDQYDLKLQIAGLSEGYDQVVIRGNPADRSFACLYLRDGRLIAADAINSPKDFIQSKAHIKAGTVLDIEKLQDPDMELKDHAV